MTNIYLAAVPVLVLLGCGRSTPTPAASGGGADRGAASGSVRFQSDNVPSLENSFEQQLDRIVSGQQTALQLLETPITQPQIEQLPTVQAELTDLLLDAGGVADLDCRVIAELTHLEHLRIRESKLGDSALIALASGQLSQLRILNLPAASVTAEGLYELSRLSQLEQLRLGGRLLDDQAMEAIASFPNLRSLHLIAPQISDAGLMHLAAAPRLSSLYVDDCDLSSAAWESLFDAKPNLHVHVDQAHHDRDPSKHAH